MKHPTVTIDVTGWLADRRLRRLDLAGRGLLIDLLALAELGQPRGALACDGASLTLVEIARTIDARHRNVLSAADDLIIAGLLVRDAAGLLRPTVVPSLPAGRGPLSLHANRG